MTGQLAVVIDGSIHGVAGSFPGPDSCLNFRWSWTIHFDRRLLLATTGLVEAKLLFALDLHDSRILDYDLYRPKTHAADGACDAPQNLVAWAGLGLNLAPAGKN
jgi:hypothetical protein